MRLVDADELKIYISTTFCDTCKRDKGVCSSCAFDDVFIAIEDAPTIDAEPVVRCKDCRYNTYNPRLFYSNDMTMTYAWCSMIIDASNGEGFCSFAKDLESEKEE